MLNVTNESNRTCRVVDCTWEVLNITNVCDCKRATKQHKGVCPFTSITKTRQPKQYHLELSVSLLDINFDGFSSAKLYQQRISCLLVVMKKIYMKKIYNFHEKSELPKFIHPFIHMSSAVFGLEMKNLQRSEQAHFLVSWLRR